MKNSALLIVVMAMLSDQVNESRRVLLIPFNMNSHYLYFGRLGIGMARMGDEVSMLVASNNKLSHFSRVKNFEVIRYTSRFKTAFSDSEEMQQKYYEYAMQKSLYSFYQWFRSRFMPSVELEMHDVVFDTSLMIKLKNMNFEFLILDMEPLKYLQVFPFYFNIPYAFITLPFVPWHFGVPRLPSTNANLIFAFSDQLCFRQRLLSLSFDMFVVLTTALTHPSQEWQLQALEHFQVQIISNKDFVRGASLFMYLEDSVISYPQATMPNTISVGDIVADQKTSPLPEDLAEFTKERLTVLVSFGSFFSLLPPQQTNKFCSVFARGKEFNFIWKFKNASVCGHSLKNLLIREWLPQNDLIGQVSAFVSHGGFNSVMESVYHATPLILFPLAVDQHYQAHMASQKNFGVVMDIAQWEVDDLLDNIRSVVNNETFRAAVTKHSAILKHRSLTAPQRVSHAIDHVVRFGDSHLKGSSNHLYWFQLFMLDIFIFIFVVVILFISSLAFICCCTKKKLTRLSGKSCKNKSKTN